MPAQHDEGTSPVKSDFTTHMSPVGDIPVVVLMRADSTVDHRSKAEKPPNINANTLLFSEPMLHPCAESASLSGLSRK